MSASEAEALAQALVEGGGLPEEWLARVQEGGPSLLLPVEENGAPWYRETPEALEENSLQEGTLFPSPRVPQSQPPPSHFERPEKIAGVASDSTTPWTSREPVERSESSASRPEPRWSERLKQGLQDVVRNPLGNESRSKTQMVEKQGDQPEKRTENVTSPSRGRAGESAPKTEHHGPRHVYDATRQNRQDEGSTSQRAEAAGFPSEAVRSLLQPPAVFRRPEPVTTDVVRLGGSGQPSSEKIPASAPNPKMWPPFPDLAGNPAFPIQKILPSDEVKFDTKKAPFAPASADPWALGSDPWPKSERSDLWPELPEEEPMQAVEGLQLLRASERLRALDFEQRGGR